jgi:RNA polymerase sigma-70 factor (ECF subfamily)
VPWIRGHPVVEASAYPARPDAETDDAALALAARANPQAYTLLYERYVDRIHRYCYLKLGSRDAAEDATSQVFLEALDGLARYRGGYFAGWLFRIAQHTVTDIYRQRRAALPLDAADQVADPAPQPEHAAIARGELDALRLALQALPADQRAVMELQLADLSTQEIAAALGRSTNAIRIIRHRAFQRLRTTLSTHGVEIQQGAQPC